MRCGLFLALACLFSAIIPVKAGDADLLPAERLTQGNRPHVKVERVVSKQIASKKKGEYELEILVVYPPDWQPGDKRAFVVASYGSGWLGHRSKASSHQKLMDRFLAKLAFMAVEHGVVGFVYDYRDGKENEKLQIGDAKSAIRYARKNAAEYGIDPDRLISAGGSSGGHLSASAVLFDDFNDPADDLSIPTRGALAHLSFNGVLSRPNAETSPAHNLDKGFPPALVMFGDQDRWKRTSDDFVERAKKVPGQIVDYRVIPGAKHDFHLFDPAFHQTLGMVDEFLLSQNIVAFQPIIPTGGSVSLSPLAKALEGSLQLRGKSSSVPVKFGCSSGGRVDSKGLFTSDGKPGVAKVWAEKAGEKRFGLIRVAQIIPGDSGTVESTGDYAIYLRFPQDGVRVQFEGVSISSNGKELLEGVQLSLPEVKQGIYPISSAAVHLDAGQRLQLETAGENSKASADAIVLVPATDGFLEELRP